MINPTLNKISLLKRLPRLRSFYRRAKGTAPLPVNLTLSLLYSCNSRCNTCNVYEKRVKNFTVDEYDKTLASIGRVPYWFTLSGGEPFLRKDIVDICRVVYDRCRPAIINIPTNGSLKNVVPERVEKILKQIPETELVINLSLDGIEAEHDRIRGYPGSWQRAMETYSELKKLKKYANFTLGIHTVISKFNVERFPEIYHELQKLAPDSYITEIAEERVELGTVGLEITPSEDEYSKAIDFLIAEMEKSTADGIARIAKSFRFEYYQLVKKYLRQSKQIIPCYAGVASAQISPDGDVWPCCVRADSMGNLREQNYNFAKVWNSEKARTIRKSIKNRECACPLANASYTNFLVHSASLFRVVKRLFL